MSRDVILLSSSVMLVALVEWLLYVRGSVAILQISLIMFAMVFFPSAALQYQMLSSSKLSLGFCHISFFEGCSFDKYFLKEDTGHSGFPEK
jgi:hypothetical protein